VETSTPSSTPPPLASTDPGQFPAACASCGYLLHGLPAGPCPEWGQPFDTAESATHTYAGWFNPWLYWLPAVLASALVVAILTPLLVVVELPLLIPIIAGPAVVGLLCHYGHGDLSPRALMLALTSRRRPSTARAPPPPPASSSRSPSCAAASSETSSAAQ
jgi:hypothetical protein